MADHILVHREFSSADQTAFARWSGDWNPMHMSESAARRTQAGAPVVHGVHSTLWALDQLVDAAPPLDNLASLKVQFNKFLYLNQVVGLQITRRTADSVKAAIIADGQVLIVLTLNFGSRQRSTRESLVNLGTWPARSDPDHPSLAAMKALAGWIVPPSGAPAGNAAFPALSAALGGPRVCAIAQLSTLVGMACPGLHSIFSEFAIRIVDNGEMPAGLGWRTLGVDERFRLIRMEVQGSGIEGEVSAFMRAEPVEPPSVASMSGIAQGEFANRFALIVGGSRGLGAVTAKLLAAGGARVVVTYAKGKVEAETLASEICSAKAEGAAAAIKCDVNADVVSQLAGLPNGITHLYYFATPQIFRQTAQIYSRQRFEEFRNVYVDGFWRVCGWVAKERAAKGLRVFYPSSVALVDRPNGMTEYAMAKAAGEVLAKDMEKAFGLRLTMPRIERVLTDQTATALPVKAADAVEVMLPLLRTQG